MPRACAERRPLCCTSSRATFSAYRESPARSPRNTASACWITRLPGTVRPPSGGRPWKCVPIRFPTCSSTRSTDAATSSSLAGYRTLLSTPMILQDEVVGVLSMWRTNVAPFDDRERELLEEFAAQGAIALRQVDLMRALESRGAELASKVAQLEALREVGEAVGSTLDLDEVLDQIVSNAVRLTRTDGGSIMEYDESSDSFHVRAASGSSPALLKQLRAITIDRESTLVGRAATAHRTLEVPDLVTPNSTPIWMPCSATAGGRCSRCRFCAANRSWAYLVIRRRSTGSFGPHLELLETFARQSALAIVNARLFRELQTKTEELEIASRHKSEFLASMSHELRTPLNAVIGFSEVLLDRMFGEINERQDEYLRDIWNSGRHLLELLNEILDLSKVEAGENGARAKHIQRQQRLGVLA